MAIFEITEDRILPVRPTSFDVEGVKERSDLQRLLRDTIGVVSADTLVLAEEFGSFEESQRRIDLLALDKEASIVVVELKRSHSGGHMDLQAIRYAAMVSAMTFDQAVEAHAHYLASRGHGEDARSAILEFLDWQEPAEEDFGKDVRVLLVAADFSKELTTSVMWLNDRDLDIRCVRLRPYSLEGRVLVDVQQVIPLPEAAEFQVRVREKARKERKERQDRSELSGHRLEFWTAFCQLFPAAAERDGAPSASSNRWRRVGEQGLLISYYCSSRGVGLFIRGPRGGSDEETKAALLPHAEKVSASLGVNTGDGPTGFFWDWTEGDFKDSGQWNDLATWLHERVVAYEGAIRSCCD